MPQSFEDYVSEKTGAQPIDVGGTQSFDDYVAEQKAMPVEQPKSGIIRRYVADPAVSALKGAVGFDEGLVGLADLASGGHAGKLVQDSGIDFASAQQGLSDIYSPEQQLANKNVQQAEGLLPTLQAVAENLSVIPHSIIESVLLMIGGQAIAKGALQAAPKIAAKLSPLTAGAIGEGVVTAGSNAEQTRQQTDNGLLTPAQSAINAGSGLITGLITQGSGQIANELGVGDVNALFLGGNNQAIPGKGILRRSLEGGGLEAAQEFLQSGQEQAATNIALNKPINQGVGNAAVVGAATGFGMGAPVGPLSKAAATVQPPPQGNNGIPNTEQPIQPPSPTGSAGAIDTGAVGSAGSAGAPIPDTGAASNGAPGATERRPQITTTDNVGQLTPQETINGSQKANEDANAGNAEQGQEETLLNNSASIQPGALLQDGQQNEQEVTQAQDQEIGAETGFAPIDNAGRQEGSHDNRVGGVPGGLPKQNQSAENKSLPDTGSHLPELKQNAEETNTTPAKTEQTAQGAGQTAPGTVANSEQTRAPIIDPVAQGEVNVQAETNSNGNQSVTPAPELADQQVPIPANSNQPIAQESSVSDVKSQEASNDNSVPEIPLSDKGLGNVVVNKRTKQPFKNENLAQAALNSKTAYPEATPETHTVRPAPNNQPGFVLAPKENTEKLEKASTLIQDNAPSNLSINTDNSAVKQPSVKNNQKPVPKNSKEKFVSAYINMETDKLVKAGRNITTAEKNRIATEAGNEYDNRIVNALNNGEKLSNKAEIPDHGLTLDEYLKDYPTHEIAQGKEQYKELMDNAKKSGLVVRNKVQVQQAQEQSTITPNGSSGIQQVAKEIQQEKPVNRRKNNLIGKPSDTDEGSTAPNDQAQQENPVKSEVPRLGESGDDVFNKFKELSKGVVSKYHGIVYPVAHVIGVGDFQLNSDGKLEKISNQGLSTILATKDEIDDVHDSFDKDQVQIITKTRWGGSGNDKGRRELDVLHRAHGLSFKHNNGIINNIGNEDVSGGFSKKENDIRFSRHVSKTTIDDAAYMDAVNSGDMDAAQRMVDEVAGQAGYGQSDYRIAHKAPGRDSGHAITDLTAIYPDDIYSSSAVQYYGDGQPSDYESMHNLRSVKGARDGTKITVYRAVPKTVKGGAPRNGDWITLSPDYARGHGKLYLTEGYKIISYEANVEDVFTDGNSINELGYDDGKNYGYANAKNNRKLLDPVTYDDEGGIITLSKRFNKRNFDTRYSKNKPTKGSTIEAIKAALPRRVKPMVKAGKLVVLRNIGDLSDTVLNRSEVLYHTAWHGGPHDHDKFDSSKIGTGEGAQAFGYGHYMSDLKSIGEWYRDKLSGLNADPYLVQNSKLNIPDKLINDVAKIIKDTLDESFVPDPDEMFAELEQDGNIPLSDAIRDAKRFIEFKRLGASDNYAAEYSFHYAKLEERQKIFKKIPLEEIQKIPYTGKLFYSGKLYEVELAPTADDYLDWNKPLSEQSELIKDALKNSDLFNQQQTGESIYHQITYDKDSNRPLIDGKLSKEPADKSASEYLHSLGIRGIRYKADEGKSDANNYVIFSDDDITITKKFSKSYQAAEGLYDRQQDKLYLFSDNITKANLDSVLYHELLHRAEATDQKLQGAIERFVTDIATRFNLASRGIGSTLEKNAYRRVITAKTPIDQQQEEFRAYLVSEYLRNPTGFIGKLKRIFDDFIASLRVVLVHAGIDFNLVRSLSPADLFAMSKYGSRVDLTVSNRTEIPNSSSVLASAKANGYQGTDTSEAFEWLRAKAKGLDMSKKARMERAKDMGFSTKVWHHATASSVNFDSEGFDTSRGDLGAHFGNINQAFHVMEHRNSTQGRIIDVLLAVRNPIRLKDVGSFHADGIARQLESKGLLGKGEGKRIEKEIDENWRLRKKYDPYLIGVIKEAGYDGVVYKNTNEGVGDSIIVFDNYKIRSVDAAFDPDFKDSGNLLASAQAQRFYSALRRAFLQAPDKVFGNPAQIKAWINGNAPKFDVKKDEIYWSGLNEWLDIQQGKVSKQDVLSFLDQNGVQVKDVVLAERDKDKAIQNWLDGADSRVDEHEDEEGDVDGYTAQYVGEFILNRHGEQKVYETEEDAWDALKNEAESQITEFDDSAPEMPKHNTEQLTLPGGVNYRELVITIPTTEPYNESDTTHFGDIGKGKQIAWIRYNERVNPDGNKVLFLEEIQSQRGADGRTKGFRSEKKKWYVAHKGNHGGTVGVGFNTKEEAENKLKETWADKLDKMEVRLSYYSSIDGFNRDKGIPPAPFVTDSNNKATNAYISLMLKKAISLAIDNGQESVSWTTGEQQADRYDLSKTINEVVLTRDNHLIASNHNNVVVLNKYIENESEVADYIGKEPAEKLFSQPYTKKGIVEAKRISGLDLKVGGDWTKAMYGNEQGLNGQGKPSLIMQAAMEIARKMGGKMGQVEILNGNINDWTKQPALIITDAMRQKVIDEGMPLFSKQSPDINYSIAADLTDWATGRDRNIGSLRDLDIVRETGHMPHDNINMQQVLDKAATMFVDSSRPFDAWARKLPNTTTSGQMILAKDRSKRRTAAMEKEAMDSFLHPLAKVLGKIAKDTGMDYRAVSNLAGHWMSQRYAIEKNSDYILQDQQAVDDAKQALNESPDDPGLKSALTKAKNKQEARLKAVNEERYIDPTNESLAIGLAGGYNNFTAKEEMRKTEKVIPIKELKEAAQPVYDMMAWKVKRDLQNGKVTQDQVDKWFDSPYYVPLTGDPGMDASEDELFNTGALNQQSDKRAVGRAGSIAQSGIDAATEQVSKSARYHGWVDFKDKFTEIYDDLIQAEMNNGATQREAQIAVQDKYGIRRMPETPMVSPSTIIIRKNGKSWAYDIGDKAAMDALRSVNHEDTPSALRAVAFFTISYARMVILMMPGFGPINAIRDTWERSENIRSRMLPGYENVDMNKVARAALLTAADPRLFRKLMGVMFENTDLYKNGLVKKVIPVDLSNPDIKLIHEMIAEGGTGTVGDYLSNTNESLAEQMRGQLKLSHRAMAHILEWNNSFELVSSFSIYKALRNAGVDKKTAASGTLNMMNFGKKGTITGPLKALYVFVNPTMQGGHQLIQTLSTERGRARAVAYTLAGMMLYAMLRAGDDDDETGANRLDELGNFMLERNIPVRINGTEIARLPVGFGLPQMAWSIAVNLVKMLDGRQEPGDTTAEILKSWSRTLAPVAPSETSIARHPFIWMAQTFTPQIAKPIVNVALDVNTFGSPLTSASFEREDKAKSLQGRKTTPEFFKIVAKELAAFGIDTYPENIQELLRGYAVGPVNEAIKAFVVNPHKESLGRKAINPMFDRFIMAQDDKSMRDKLYYRYRDKMNDAAVKASLGKPLTAKESTLAKLNESIKRLENRANGKMAAATKAEKGRNVISIYRKQAEQMRDNAQKIVFNVYKRLE